ncbi:MAG: HlyD family efflux transporter periplasmic adaptor subunit [Rhodospirillales bacterium]|nr:HlyD family efflux transporter periplasmic adaptor subunit [Rhodospirillales bacterium]
MALKQLRNRILPALAVLVAWAGSAAAESALKVSTVHVEDMKAVFATVETSDVVSARARIGGTVTRLSVDEGTAVQAGQIIAVVGDPKIGFHMDALQARANSMKSQNTLAATALSRARNLRESGTIAQNRLDQAQSAFEVTERELEALRAELAGISRQRDEGIVQATSSGRVTKVHVTQGAVILAGETVATIAAKGFILRLNLPERHARFIHVGDAVYVGDKDTRTGHVQQVYPEIRQGRVVADVAVSGLGDYFVGERIRVLVSAGERETFVIPGDYLFQRYGLAFATLKNGVEIVVQPGLVRGTGVEVLSGLRPGDELIRPAAK